MEWMDFWIAFGKTALIYVTIIQVVPIMLFVERRGAALIQDRPGPNRVGPFGILQPLADVVKFFFKEDPIPLNVNRLLFAIGPFLCLLPASLAIAALPVADSFEILGKRFFFQISNLDVGVLYILSISSLGIYGILFGGWASNNKYSLLGALRASSQMISYELPLGLAITAAVIVYGTFNLREISLAQEGLLFGALPHWGIFFQPLGFLIFFICAFAETNRLPFDLPETEAELVAGYHTEYGSMRLATFYMAEYINMATSSGLMATLYFGGWHIPWLSDADLLAWTGSLNLVALIQFGVFFAKVSFFMILFVWVRWTLPRFRFDQLMWLAWRGLIPLSLANVLLTATIFFFAKQL